MCEIFVMFSTKNETIPRETIEKFLKTCLSASESNPHGWGAFWERSDSHGFKKSETQFRAEDIPLILRDYRGSRFFALHLRYATTKVCYSNSHPFTLKGFRGCHNGVVHTVERNGDGSDSYEMLKYIEASEGNNLGEKIVDAMKKVSGTYSVLIHAFEEQKLYYFRNMPEFSFMLDKESGMVYGATRIERLSGLVTRLYGFFRNTVTTKPTEDSVYAIDLATAQFTRVGTVKYVKPKEVTKTIVYQEPGNSQQELGEQWGVKEDWRARVYGGKR